MSGDDSRRSPRDSGARVPEPSVADSVEPARRVGDVQVVREVRARLLERLHGRERYTPFAHEVARCYGLDVDDALSALRAIHDPWVWRRDATIPGSFVFTTPALARARVVVSRLPVATRIPKHPHRSRETAFIVDGLLIEDGHKHYGPGSIMDKQAGTEHEIEVAGAHACLSLFFPARS